MVVKPTDALALLETALAYRFAGFELDTVGGRLWHGASVVPLRRRTWQLLCLFIANPRRLCHKDELLLALWPTTVVVDDSLVQCVVELRRALGDGDRQLISHVARLGYRFDADVEVGEVSPRTAARPGLGDDPLDLAWLQLTAAADCGAVEEARKLFEAAIGDSVLRGDAMAGIATAHVIDVLNRWTSSPGWKIALATEAAEEAVALSPDSASACHARAHVDLLHGRHAQAYLGFRAALRRDPRMAGARLRLGVIEMEQGHAERTAAHVRQALASGAGDEVLQAQAHFIQGMAAFHLGQDAVARDCMHRTLLLRPGSGLAHQWIAAIDAIGGARHSADHHLAAFRRLVPNHTIESLRSTERSHHPEFIRQRMRFYDGLERAGLP